MVEDENAVLVARDAIGRVVEIARRCHDDVV